MKILKQIPSTTSCFWIEMHQQIQWKEETKQSKGLFGLCLSSVMLLIATFLTFVSMEVLTFILCMVRYTVALCIDEAETN